ncbi:MAG TPA: hypothetical protein VE959_00945 [Bryobacteraceae bacterium]|nr:hypothetical protein [Bryobacteraceae bacterium]
MEARVGNRQLLLVMGLVLAIRLPFLNQAILGDDHIYLTEAAHALIEPLHPNHTPYVFMGRPVDLRGHSHPPLNAWVLAGLIAVWGDVKEVPFHAAYTVFSLIAVWAMWSLAKRFSPQPVWATLLFVAVPVFLVNGNSLEADLPFLAFWMAATALFERHRPLACAAMALAEMTAYQAVFLTPILAVYVWLYHRRDLTAWFATLAAPITFAAWQLFERLSTGTLPAGQLAAYLPQFHFFNPQARAALFIHAWFLVFPALVPGALILAWRRRKDPDTLFLLSWIALFFACGLVVFFAGSARYLLPMAAPLALLASRLRSKWLAIGFAAQMALGLSLAAVNYQHWDGYRRLANDVRPLTAGHRVWVDGEWGLRFYFERDHGLPLTKTERLRPGDIVVSSELGSAVTVNGPTTVLKTLGIRPAIPLRIIGLETHSGYSTISRGVWPFGVSSGPIDRVRVMEVVERHPALEYLLMSAPEAREQIVSGIYDLEDNSFRWMSRSGVVALKSPAEAAPLRAVFRIPDNAPARKVTVLLDGREIASQTYAAPGAYELETPPARPAGPSATVEIDIDRTFHAPPDSRDLGIVLTGLGFTKLLR